MQACRCIVSEPGQGGSCRHIDFVQPACMHVDVLPCWAVAPCSHNDAVPCPDLFAPHAAGVVQHAT